MKGGRRFFSGLAVLLIAGVLAAPAAVVAGGDSDEPALSVLLPGGVAETRLSFADLRALPWITVKTCNRFSDGLVAYSGPLVRDVLATVGLDRTKVVRFIAANDYSVDIPTSDFTRWDVILAMEADGAPLDRRATGPIWVIYPQSSDAELDKPIYSQRLIWQLIRIEAL